MFIEGEELALEGEELLLAVDDEAVSDGAESPVDAEVCVGVLVGGPAGVAGWVVVYCDEVSIISSVVDE